MVDDGERARADGYMLRVLFGDQNVADDCESVDRQHVMLTGHRFSIHCDVLISKQHAEHVANPALARSPSSTINSANICVSAGFCTTMQASQREIRSR